MVVLSGPMFSLGARGKFGDAIVYSIWKGIPYARQLLTPANPQSGDQGDRRVMLGGLGRSAKYVQSESDFEGYGKAVAPSGQSWISYYIKYIMTTYFTNVAGYDALLAEKIAHAQSGGFNTESGALGLTHFDLAYKDMTDQFENGFQLFCVAKYSTDMYLLDNTKFNAVPYTTALAAWDLAAIQAMVADF